MRKKTLLLTTTYEVLSFVSWQKVFKYLAKDKVEIISSWDDIISWGSGSIQYPAILRLKYHTRRNYFNSDFSRPAIIKRDRGYCQYCGRKLSAPQITIDHVIPKDHGGGNSFANCVVSCQECNNKKGNRTPEQAGMVLIRKPTHPSFSNHQSLDSRELWHPEWDYYLVNT
jgi:5-methylcytosine-specific restriction endonuclease McrA